MTTLPLKFTHRNALRINFSSSSTRTTPGTSFGNGMKKYWPSPHTSANLKISQGRLQIPIMYPGAKTIAASRMSHGTSLSSRKENSNMSFNLEYLQLRSHMQHENRTYTALSNIMKTKRDTVKNSINNIR